MLGTSPPPLSGRSGGEPPTRADADEGLLSALPPRGVVPAGLLLRWPLVVGAVVVLTEA